MTVLRRMSLSALPLPIAVPRAYASDVSLTVGNCNGAFAYLSGEYSGLATSTPSSKWDYDSLLRVWLSKTAATSPPAALTTRSMAFAKSSAPRSMPSLLQPTTMNTPHHEGASATPVSPAVNRPGVQPLCHGPRAGKP
jgi:hypothetical protein